MDYTGKECDYCGKPMVVCPCGLLIHWDELDCPVCGKMPQTDKEKEE